MAEDKEDANASKKMQGRRVEERLIAEPGGPSAHSYADSRAVEDWLGFKLRLIAQITKANMLFERFGWRFVYEDADHTAGAVARGMLKVTHQSVGLLDERPVVMREDGKVSFDASKEGRYLLSAMDATDADIQVMLSIVFRECDSLPWLTIAELDDKS